MWAPNGGLNIQLVSYCGMKNRIKKANDVNTALAFPCVTLSDMQSD